MMLEISKAIKVGGRAVFVEFRKEDVSVEIKLVHKMTEAQVKKEIGLSEFHLKWKETIGTLPWQHVVIFEKEAEDAVDGANAAKKPFPEIFNTEPAKDRLAAPAEALAKIKSPPPVPLSPVAPHSAVRHNIVDGLKWGPDGWLYGRHGILATSLVGKPGASASQRTPINCGIWRYHPTRKVFEVVAQGTTNAWGFDYDEHGEMFFINTVIGHLWHVVPGAHYRRMYGTGFNPHLYQLIEKTAGHFHCDPGEKWDDIRKGGVSPTTDKAGG